MLLSTSRLLHGLRAPYSWNTEHVYGQEPCLLSKDLQFRDESKISSHCAVHMQDSTSWKK